MFSEPCQYKDASCEASAPALRRRSLSKLRRRLSQTFRRSFGGSLADLGVQTFTIDEHEDEHSASLVGVSMNTGDGDSIVRTSGQRRSISEAKINGTVITIKKFLYYLKPKTNPFETMRYIILQTFISGHNSGSSSIGGSHGGGLSMLSSSRLRTITNLTRKLSLSNSRILNGENSTSRVIPHRNSNFTQPSNVFKSSRSMNGIGKSNFFIKLVVDKYRTKEK